MMVKIRRGNCTLCVPYKAYESKYKPIGYTLDNGICHFEDETPNTGMQLPDMTVDNGYLEDEYKDVPVESEEECDELDETPLSEMSLVQLQQYAKRIGLNSNGYTNKKALREAIVKAMK